MASNSTRSAAAVGAFAVLAAAITTVILVAGGTTPAAAADLQRFASCAELETWTEDVAAEQQRAFEETMGDAVALPAAGAAEGGDGAGSGGSAASGGGVARDDAATAEPSPASTAATGGDGGGETGGTNVVVEGVDEIDIVDRLPGDRALLSRNGALSLVDLAGPTLLDHVEVPSDARISVGGDVVWVAGTTWDEATGFSGTAVARYRLDGDSLLADGSWQTPGWLIDARRTGDRLHVVAVDQPQVGILPFEGGPVPCDQVWFPEAGADTPAATMVVTLPAEGELAPTAAAEVVGSGSGFLVTGDAAYVTTQSWPTDGGDVTTGVHRFDLATLAPTGSGSVPGTVPGPFGLSEHEGFLRVATSAQPAFFVGRPLPVEPATDVVGAPEPVQEEVGPLAEVFVLDLDGALDIVGRTGRFGHEGETIQGIRFVGDTGYVVTFLQTDPFWVLDLSNPVAPAILGELQIPGFSAYLHPIGDGHVVGFGPDGDGANSVRLFDVGDPAQPTVVDEVTIPGDSPVIWDYHAFVGLEENGFAVPFNVYPEFVEERCTPIEPQPEPAPEPQPLPEPEPQPLPEPQPIPVDPGIGDGTGGSTGSAEPPADQPIMQCEVITEGGETGVLVFSVDGDDLRLDDQRGIETDGNFTSERVLPHSGGWVLVGWDRLVDTDGTELVLPVGQSGGPIAID